MKLKDIISKIDRDICWIRVIDTDNENETIACFRANIIELINKYKNAQLEDINFERNTIIVVSI